jgi:hypothetical protein
MLETGRVPPAWPPSPPITKDDWWELKKRFQELEAVWKARTEEQDRLRAEHDRQIRFWHLLVTLLASSTTALLAILLTFLLAK